MKEGNVFSLSTPWGGYPRQVQMEGVPHTPARSDWGCPRGVPHPWPGRDREYPPARSGQGVPQPGASTQGTPLARSGWGYPSQGTTCLGYPTLGLVRTGGAPAWGCLPGVSPQPGQDRTVPQPRGCLPRVPHPLGIGQHMEYLMSGGRYASCVHAGGLSCSK